MSIQHLHRGHLVIDQGGPRPFRVPSLEGVSFHTERAAHAAIDSLMSDGFVARWTPERAGMLRKARSLNRSAKEGATAAYRAMCRFDLEKHMAAYLITTEELALFEETQP